MEHETEDIKNRLDRLADLLCLMDELLMDTSLGWEGPKLLAIRLMMTKMFKNSATFAYVIKGTWLIYTERTYFFDTYAVMALARSIFELCADLYYIFWEETDNETQARRLRSLIAHNLKDSEDEQTIEFVKTNRVKRDARGLFVSVNLKKFGILSDDGQASFLYSQFSGAIHTDIGEIIKEEKKNRDLELFSKMCITLVVRVLAHSIYRLIFEFPKEIDMLLSKQHMQFVRSVIDDTQ